MLEKLFSYLFFPSRSKYKVSYSRSRSRRRRLSLYLWISFLLSFSAARMAALFRDDLKAHLNVNDIRKIKLYE